MRVKGLGVFLFAAVFAVLLSFFVSAQAGTCTFDPVSKNTKNFINEVPSLNEKLQNCPVPLDSAASRVFGSSEIVQLTILRSDGTSTSFLFLISGGALSGISVGGGVYGFEVLMDECTFDTILSADSRSGAFAYMYIQGKVKLLSKGFWNRIKLTVARLFLGSAMKKMATPVDMECLKTDGEICQHGGECQSGNCVGVGQGPPWTYRCSCDPFTYKTSCPLEPVVQVDPDTGLRPAGELCDHGGQCETGNCVGVGQGPPWTYRCSCDPFKFTTAGPPGCTNQ
jgi:hypothetical protein